MKFALASFAACFLCLSAAFAEDILRDKIYVGKEIGFCGRIDAVNDYTETCNKAQPVKYVFATFSLRDNEGWIQLHFKIKSDAPGAELVKTGSFVRAYGLCMEQSFYLMDESNRKGERKTSINLQAFPATIEQAGKTDPSGFLSAEAKSSGKGAAGAGSQVRRMCEENFETAFDEQAAMKSIVSVKGAKSGGSAFVASIDGKKYIVANINAVFDSSVKFISASNERIEVLDPLLAKDRDLVLYELKEQGKLPALEIERDVAKLPAEQPVAVFGSAANARLKGKTQSVGPATVEISAEIAPGANGSPILNATSGKVVGVSACGPLTRKGEFSTKGIHFEDAPRLGARLDTLDLASLEPYDRQKFNADIKLYNAIASANELGFLLLNDICEQKDGKSMPLLDPSKYDFKKYVSLEPAIREWNDVLNGRIAANNKSTSNVASVIKRFKAQITMPIMNARKQQANYSWMKSAVAKQIELNDSYCKSFDDLRKELEDSVRK